jgi:hypothetical protein
MLGMGLTLIALLAPAAAQEAEDCLGCHSETDLTGTRDGEEISVFVDASAYGTSVHGDGAGVGGLRHVPRRTCR